MTESSESSVIMVVGSYFVARQRVDGQWVPHHGRIKRNAYEAEQVARIVMSLNTLGTPLQKPVMALTPHMNTRHFEQLTEVDEPTYQAGDRDFLRKLASALILVPNYVISAGTSKEMQLANELGIPIFEEQQSLLWWLADPDTAERRHITKTVVVRGLSVDVTWNVDRTVPPLTEEDLFFYERLDPDGVLVRFHADGRGEVRIEI